MDRQKEILIVFGSDKELILKKSDIIEKGNINYYHNTEKHVGFTLSRLVKNGLLIRIRTGYYKLGTHRKKNGRIAEIQDPDQINLFNEN